MRQFAKSLLCVGIALMPISVCAAQKTNPAASAPDKAPDYTITKIELVKQDGRNFLKLTIQARETDPKKSFYPYPTFRVISNGKVVASRDLETFGLMPTELIPTTLEALPDNFECIVIMEAHGDMRVPKHELKYPPARK